MGRAHTSVRRRRKLDKDQQGQEHSLFAGLPDLRPDLSDEDGGQEWNQLRPTQPTLPYSVTIDVAKTIAKNDGTD